MLATPGKTVPNPDVPVRPATSDAERRPPPPGGPPGFDEQMFHDLMDRFSILAEQCARFSREVYSRSGSLPQQDLDRTIRRHLDLTRAVFSEHAIELLTVVYFRGTASFKEIHEALGQISTSVLVRKLDALERFGIVQRTVAGTSAMESRYTLTHKGSVIARLGEPVMLYIRIAEGWFNLNGAATKEGSRRIGGKKVLENPPLVAGKE